MPPYNPHGEFKIEWQGHVLVVAYKGSWNLQAVHALHEEARQLWAHRPAPNWAMLTDARAWEGGNPEVLDYWWLFFADAVDHGMTVVTDILPSSFHQLIVNDLAERASKIVTFRHSADFPDAWNWLGEHGFKHET